MTSYTDLSLVTDSAYRLADLINGGYYSDILYYEFHEPVDPKTHFNAEEGVKSFSKKLEENLERGGNLENIFFSQYYMDDLPAIIHIAVKIASEWFIARNCGSNYYLGYGPTGILRLREACAIKHIASFISEDNFEKWLKKKFEKPQKTATQEKKINEANQFKIICSTIEHLTLDMQRRPDQYQHKSEEKLRDNMLVSLNASCEGRGHGESKNGKGKTDILIRTKNGRNEHIFELKVWKGIDTLKKSIEQLQSYLGSHNNYCGIIMFCYNANFTQILNTVEKYLHINFKFDKREENDNTFRFRMTHKNDIGKSIQTHLTLVNLRTTKKKKNSSR